jgi:cytochrome P450
MASLPPGPKLPSVVQAWLWAYRYREFTQWAHRRYGPSFTARIGGLPTSVVTTDRDAIRRLLTGNPSTKRHANDLLREALGDRSLLLLEPDEHLQRRKLLTPPFHGERVREYAQLMERLVEQELEGWKPGTEVGVGAVAQRLTLEVILEAVLGVSDPGMRDRLRWIFDAMLSLPVAAIGFYFPALQKRRRWNRVAEMYWRKRDEHDRMLKEQIAATRADPQLEDRPDILAMMVRARDEDGGALTDTDLLHELTTLIAAGHETTATALAWGAELLAHNPEVQARARAARRDGDQRYLDALVKEVLRIRAPVTVGSARHPLEPFEIGGCTIGPETVVTVDAWGVHLDPSVYPEPDRFMPERFLEPAPEYGFLPFGGGAHRCLGAALAQLEMRVVLGAIVERFELLPTRPALARPVRRGILLVPDGGGRVRLAAAPAPAAAGATTLEPVPAPA